MTKHELKTLIQLAEKELECVTPGAYIHRKVAVRCLELLQEMASREASQAIANTITTANNKINSLTHALKEKDATIERQAKALTELQRPKPDPYSSSPSALNRPALSPLTEAMKQRQREEQYLRQKELERYPAKNFPEKYPDNNPFKSRMDDYFRDAKDLFNRI